MFEVDRVAVALRCGWFEHWTLLQQLLVGGRTTGHAPLVRGEDCRLDRVAEEVEQVLSCVLQGDLVWLRDEIAYRLISAGEVHSSGRGVIVLEFDDTLVRLLDDRNGWWRGQAFGC